MTSKVTTKTDEPEYLVETVNYTYNLQNRLGRVETIDHVGSTTTIVAYKYNPDGIRVAKIEDPDGTPVITDYLIDSYNHTGYAQVFVEDDGTDVTSYFIGDDVLAQATNADNPEYLLYDGHGSTRQIADDAGQITDSYSYDGYGVMLGGNPGSPSNPSDPSTHLLYTGEQFDVDAQMYYLRARWYNQNNGRFNRTDPVLRHPIEQIPVAKWL